MKYRIQFSAVFNNTNSNAILDQLETIKTKVYNASQQTIIPIVRESKKQDYTENIISNIVVHDSVDYDLVQTTHTGAPSGISEFEVVVDISFTVLQDFYDCINYFESVKTLSDSTKKRYCRHFECKHEEQPLTNDGAYTYMDFSGAQLTYPIIP